ncbi:MAG: GDSL-type esterase/lipase family protein [Gemmiger sp.]|nr:GDSL-type esterase/lipase family protein [Gemmiger sp.]
MNLTITSVSPQSITLAWQPLPQAAQYRLKWSDRATATAQFKIAATLPAEATGYTFKRSTHRPYHLILEALDATGAVIECTAPCKTPVARVLAPQLEALSRGLVAVKANTGVFISWRFFKTEAAGYTPTGLAGMDFALYKNGTRLALVTDSTNYLDATGTAADCYAVAPVFAGVEYPACRPVRPWQKGYYDLPLTRPAGGVTPAGQPYCYHANDMSVGDVDGDGEYEYFVKWDPDNSQDVSIKGYTGHCLIDCYKLDGTLLWRLDMGPNIRAGAHYTQFMVYDFDGDGRAEMAVKTAPGTRITRYAPDGTALETRYITMPPADLAAGYAHTDAYACSAAEYRAHLAATFRAWQHHPEVVAGRWPPTLEECFGIPVTHAYPLSSADAEALADYFINVYAPGRSPKNRLDQFEGFIYQGPEYLSMFDGTGAERQTIPFPFPRVDDGLLWGDYAMPRIEPCNRVDRFLSGVAYLDGKRPYLIVCRGYYTRTAVAAYDFFSGHFHEVWRVDSGFVPMSNPFHNTPHTAEGADPVFGRLAGQGNHSLSAADVDGDGCMEIVYGAAVIDHDGSLLYSSYGALPDGRCAKFGHGDAMQVADIDPDRPGLEIFNVFEGAENAPYGYALRDAETGQAYFGEYAEEDLGRCMVGDVVPGVRGLQVWVNELLDCHGKPLGLPAPGTNARIYWAGDLSTQIIDGQDYLHEAKCGAIHDLQRGCLLRPHATATNNGTKGNPCLIADVLGDFREELLLRKADDTAIRIYTTTELTHHKLFTLMQDAQYRCGIAWQNNCYNQPVYPSFYYARDMAFDGVLPQLGNAPTLYLAGDSTMQSYPGSSAPQCGWGQQLWQQFAGAALCHTAHRADCPYPQEVQYRLPALTIDNCAMAGRSSRTFREEGRLDDIAAHLRPGDFLVVQFAHNDAYAQKPERYTAPEHFAAALRPYLDAARQKGAQCILVSPIALREFDGSGHCPASFAPYRAAMAALAAAEDIPYLDMGAATAALCQQAGPLRTKNLFLWLEPGAYPQSNLAQGCQDNAHLQLAGATRFAAEFARLLATTADPRLQFFKNLINQNGSVL